MQAGRLRDRLTLQNSVSVRQSSGQPKKEWQDTKTGIRAEVRGISGRELMTAGAEKAEATIRVWIRYRADVYASSRFVCETGPFKGLILEICGPPIPDDRKTRLEILCKQGVKA